MGSLLVQTMFGERVVGILVWQSGKRSSENGVQTTFWGGLEREVHKFRLRVVCVKRRTVGCKLQLASIRIENTKLSTLLPARTPSFVWFLATSCFSSYD